MHHQGLCDSLYQTCKVYEPRITRHTNLTTNNRTNWKTVTISRCLQSLCRINLTHKTIIRFRSLRSKFVIKPIKICRVCQWLSSSDSPVVTQHVALIWMLIKKSKEFSGALCQVGIYTVHLYGAFIWCIAYTVSTGYPAIHLIVCSRGVHSQLQTIRSIGNWHPIN